MSSEESLETISGKLSLLIRLQLLQMEDKTSRKDQVAVLSSFGLPNDDIAAILGTTKNTVEVIKSQLKRKHKGVKK